MKKLIAFDIAVWIVVFAVCRSYTDMNWAQAMIAANLAAVFVNISMIGAL